MRASIIFAGVFAAMFAADARCQIPDAAGGDIVLSTSAGVGAGQIYRQDIARDPFVPVALVSGAQADLAQALRVTAPGSAEPAEFDPRNLEISGIMTEPKGRVALLCDKVSALPYYLSKGRLYDGKKKPVSGISGVIQNRQVTLFLGGSEIVTTSLAKDFLHMTPARGADAAASASKKQELSR